MDSGWKAKSRVKEPSVMVMSQTNSAMMANLTPTDSMAMAQCFTGTIADMTASGLRVRGIFVRLMGNALGLGVRMPPCSKESSYMMKS